MGRGVHILQATIAPDQSGWRLDKALAALFPDLSRERVKALIAAGHVAGEAGPVRDPALKTAPGRAFTLTLPDAAPAGAAAQPIALSIVHEDDTLIVVDKPAGLVVHPAAGNPDGTLVNALLHHCAGGLSGIGGVARPGIVHRIDKDTSGLLVVAKTDRAHEGLARQFAEHSVDRRYVAVIGGLPKAPMGRVDAAIARHPVDRKRMAIVDEGRGRRAVTHWRVTERFASAAALECRLETGRTHQVRVHMASIGHPLVGDPVYGRARAEHKALGFARQALHARTLGFVHPVSGERLGFDSPLPADMQELFSALRV